MMQAAPCRAQPNAPARAADSEGQSLSTFHQHFRAVTSLSPHQFQEQSRLIEARRLMLSEGAPASTAAYAVGYESLPQSTREHARMFGAPPVREIRLARERPSATVGCRIDIGAKSH